MLSKTRHKIGFQIFCHGMLRLPNSNQPDDDDDDDDVRCDRDVDDVDNFVGIVRLVEALLLLLLLLLLVGLDLDDDDVSSAYQIPPTATVPNPNAVSQRQGS